MIRVRQGMFDRFYFLQGPLKCEEFLANALKVIDYLSECFGWFVGGGHHASRLPFCGRKVSTLAVYARFGSKSNRGAEIIHKIIHKAVRIRDYCSKLHEVAESAGVSRSAHIHRRFRTFCYTLHRLVESLGSWRSTAELLPRVHL